MDDYDNAVSSVPTYRTIPLYVPDMPTFAEIGPWLKMIDERHWYTNNGPLNQLFEAALGQCFPFSLAVHLATVSSGTLGLELALAALDLPERSSVLVPSFTFPATATAVLRAGLIPVLADLDPATWHLTPEIAREALNHVLIHAIVPVATFGCPQSTHGWDKFSADTGIPVIIDAAGAWGFQTIGKSTAVVFSLHATKNVSAGEGGIVASADTAFIEQIINLRNFGFKDGVVQRIGTNAKLSEYHAAVGLASLERWQRIQHDKKKLYHAYRIRIDNTRLAPVYQVGMETVVPSIFTLRLPGHADVALLAAHLREKGIQTRRWYYPPLHQHPAFAKLLRADDLEVTREFAGQILGMPFHTGITPADIDYICFWLDQFYL